MIGIDAVDVPRLRQTLERSPGLEDRLFTAAERAHGYSSKDPVMHLAGTLAAKEAVIKAGRLGSLVAWTRRISIERDPSGAPAATIDGIYGPINVSISHDGGMAIAVAHLPSALSTASEAICGTDFP